MKGVQRSEGEGGEERVGSGSTIMTRRMAWSSWASLCDLILGRKGGEEKRAGGKGGGGEGKGGL